MTSNDQNAERETVMIEVHPTRTPVRDLPAGLQYDVTQVLRAHGLDIQDGSEHVALLLALGQVVEAVAVERGGRRES